MWLGELSDRPESVWLAPFRTPTQYPPDATSVPHQFAEAAVAEPVPTPASRNIAHAATVAAIALRKLVILSLMRTTLLLKQSPVSDDG